MIVMKKLLLVFLSTVFLFSAGSASAESAVIDFFFSPTCSHCAEEEIFLDELQEEYPNLVINRYSVFETKNVDLLKEYYEEYNVPASYHGMVPATFTDEEYFIGFTEEIGKEIRGCVDRCEAGDVSEENTSPVSNINPNNYSKGFFNIFVSPISIIQAIYIMIINITHIPILYHAT